MYRTGSPSILILEPDAPFREELHNFLLSAGYEIVETAESPARALDKLAVSAYDFMLADAAYDRLAIRLAEAHPGLRLILMIEAGGESRETALQAQYLIKSAFALNLPRLLVL